jgi:hypothetical protein
MRNPPGKRDRLVGQQELGGFGGGSYVCPIFDGTGRECQNFGFDPTNVPANRGELLEQLHRVVPVEQAELLVDRVRDVVPPKNRDPFEDPGMVVVLNIPTLFYYSLETHYGIDPTEGPPGESPEARKARLLNFQLLNWLVLITRAVEDPTSNKQVEAFLNVALVTVKLLAPVTAKPDPRTSMLSVQTSMGGQLVDRKSFGIVIGNDARILRRREVQELIDDGRRRTEGPLSARLGR